MKIFISWSGSISHGIALALRDWLPVVLPFVQTWVSSEDIPKGSRWGTELASELDATDCGLVCVTPANIDEPWLNFEAGALSKSVDRARVHPFLVGVEPGELRGPLAQFQATRFDKVDVRRLVKALNSQAGVRRLPEESVDRNLSIFWPDLERRLAPFLVEVAIPPTAPEVDRGAAIDVASAVTLSEDEIAVLRLMVDADGERAFPKGVGKSLNLHPERARHLMESLEAKALLQARHNYVVGTSWYLSGAGRAWLVDRGHL